MESKQTPLLQKEEKEFAKAATSGQGNRKERRARQAELRKLMKRKR